MRGWQEVRPATTLPPTQQSFAYERSKSRVTDDKEAINDMNRKPRLRALPPLAAIMVLAVVSALTAEWVAAQGTGAQDAIAALTTPAPQLPKTAIPAAQSWMSTGIYLDKGHKLLIDEVENAKPVLVKGDKEHLVGARGTYLFDVENQPFPLEPDRLHTDRRYPGYCLIGKMGASGVPFFVGKHFQGLTPGAGILFLGINDPVPYRNQGSFECTIAQDYPDPPLPKPAANDAEARVQAKANPDPPRPIPPVVKPPTAPVADANVVIIYVDGLRPDVITEMAQWGHVPNFNRLFMEYGTWIRNSFTVLPSLTLTSFSSMITGDFSNHHGVKMQTYYDRDENTYINGLTTKYITRFADEVKQRGVKTIYDYFPDTFSATAMPYEPARPHVLQMNLAEWMHRAVNVANYGSNIRHDMDDVQTKFALDIVSEPKVKVSLIWLPSNDSVSEHTPHGQFGGARTTIAHMDEDLGKIVDRIKNRHRYEKTYFILVSDHGHSGGHEIVNQRYDIKREVFHAYFQMNVENMWDRFDYPGAPSKRFGAVSDCDGAVGIFLPVGSVDSGEFVTPNTYAQLANYGMPDGSKANAVELFAEYNAKGRWPQKDEARRPVDFAVARVDTDTVLVHKTTARQAIINTRKNEKGVAEYKYTPVQHYTVGQPLQPLTTGDPLGYLDNEEFRKQVKDVAGWLANYHTGVEWLQATCKTDYPGCVDTLEMYFRWDGPVTKSSPVPSQPCILLFANRGWVFESHVNLNNQHEDVIGSRHGMAFREATNNSFFFSGPGIRKRAIIDTPHRMVDLMPTVMHIMGRDADASAMDGKPVQEIWEGFE